MKKLFTLIATAFVALSVNAQTYTFDNQASTYVVTGNGEVTTYKMDGEEGFSVNYTTGDKMQVKLAANEDIFFEYQNSSNKNNVVKSGKTLLVCDAKNFVLNIPVKTGDEINLEYSAKGSTAAKVEIYGDEPAIALAEGSVNECASKDEPVSFKAVATKGGTAKIKETNGGMRVYKITISNTTTAIQNVEAAAAQSVRKVATANGIQIVKAGKTFNVAGQEL